MKIVYNLTQQKFLTESFDPMHSAYWLQEYKPFNNSGTMLLPKLIQFSENSKDINILAHVKTLNVAPETDEWIVARL